MRHWLTYALLSCCFFLVLPKGEACDRSSLDLVSITPNGGEFDIILRLGVGGGILGTTVGGDNPTSTFAFGFYTVGSAPITVTINTPTVTGDSTGGVYNATLTGPFLGSQEGVGYITSGTLLACISSTALCGRPHTSLYDFSFTVSILPEIIEVFGIEGNGNPNAGCPLMVNTNSLPVEWQDFTGNLVSNGIALRWSTLSEENNLGFYLERKTLLNEWKTLGFVPPIRENLSVRNYTFLDSRPYAGENFYRVRQEDVDGAVNFSPIIHVRHTAVVQEKIAYPNPARNQIHLESAVEGTLRLINLQGQQVRHWAIDQQTSFEVAGLPRGVYLLSITNDDGLTITERLVLD